MLLDIQRTLQGCVTIGDAESSLATVAPQALGSAAVTTPSFVERENVKAFEQSVAICDCVDSDRSFVCSSCSKR